MQTYKELSTDLYGECIHSAFKRLDRLTNQRSRLVNNLAFLKRCLDNKVVPKGLRISTKYYTKYARKIMMKPELALVRERIAWTRRQLCRVDERISSLNEELWLTLNEEHYATAKRMISVSSTKTFNKACSTQIAKFTKLTSFGRMHRRQEDLASHPLQCTVINTSARRLTPVEEDVLALGLNFAVVPCVLPKEEFVQRLEPKLYHMTNDAASNIRIQITEVLRCATLPASNLTKNKKDALRNLRADKLIHILKADKGNATVIF
jgi:hypothetical protein